MPRTLKDWAEDPNAREQLAAALRLPVMREALDTLRELNRPTTEIPALFPGTTGMETLAITNAQRAGGHGMLNSLISIPHLSNHTMRALTDPSLRSDPILPEDIAKSGASRKRTRIQ